MPELVTESELQCFLDQNSHWSGTFSGLTSEFIAPSFSTVIEFVNSVAAIAERLDHHPDIDIRWNRVTFGVSTHSAGGVTALDFELAAAIDSAAKDLFGS
jgi:4a-hydroxytetrahydrobiopterin dehydratase